MKYSIDKIHQKKNLWERGNGKTVDVLMDAIGMVMVTENKVVPIVVPFLTWVYHYRKEFMDIVINHFNEEPVIKRQEEFLIKGYSSRIRLFSESQWERWDGRGLNITRILYDN